MTSNGSATGSSNHLDDIFVPEDFSHETLDRWKKNKVTKQIIKEIVGLGVEKLIQRLEQVVTHNCSSEEQLCALKYSLIEDQKMRDAQLPDMEKVLQQKATLDKLLVGLQKKQKELVEENRRITEEENQRRQEIARAVQHTISDVKGKMEEQAGERLQQARESEGLRHQFRALVDQYEVREKALAVQQREREEEVAQLEMVLQAQEQKAHEDLQQARHFLQANKVLQQGEIQLRSQLKQYGEKLSAFQKTLNNSHIVFQQYKQELTKLREAKKRMDADKERYILRAKEVHALEASKAELEEMCRALRSECVGK
eukprot:GEMP01045140.1.p1 GENE.GEMP01045140.1~~GEMP01045140.1.p1  ORF type:complete len:313 (+),score=90.50 GEMP01045140.1:92-1030(+)